MIERSLIIAEAGVNHDGDLKKALELVNQAKIAGADCVKFQSFKADDLVTTTAPLASYQRRESPSDRSQHQMLRRLELSKDDHVKLKAYCEDQGIEFLSTPFDTQMLSLLLEVGVNRIKISSGDLNNYELLEAAATSGKNLILSTGMANAQEVKETALFLRSRDVKPNLVTFLQCTTQYPTPFRSANLRAMETLKALTGSPVGFSDHTLGIHVSIAAVALGATVIEKHLTLDKDAMGPDHSASLNPEEFASLVRGIREIEESLGSGVKEVQPDEFENVKVARKSLVARTPISMGDVFSRSNLTAKRPGGGIPPSAYFEILGMTAKKEYDKDELIEL